MQTAAAPMDDWLAAVRSVLRSAPNEDPRDRLRWRTHDGLQLNGLYTAQDYPDDGWDDLSVGRPPFRRYAEAMASLGAAGGPAPRRSWDVRQQQGLGDAAATNAAILDDLANGGTSVWLRTIDRSGPAVGDLERALKGVHLEAAGLWLDAGVHTPAAVAALAGFAPAGTTGSFGVDPIGWQARTGEPADLGMLAALLPARRALPGMSVAVVDCCGYVQAGAGDADELAVSLAVGVSYLRALVQAGLTIEAAWPLIEFRYSVNTDIYAGIAKLRAGRVLWSRIAESCGPTASGMGLGGQRQHAVTSTTMLSRLDPWSNLIRATLACAAAALGGAPAVTVLPFAVAADPQDTQDSRQTDSDAAALGRRVARNTAALLSQEAGLLDVIDPAGGSYFVESFTDQLCQAAWQRFTAIEQAGGALAALNSGHIATLLATTQQYRAQALATRTEIMVGVNQFAEAPQTHPAVPTPASGPEDAPAASRLRAGALPMARYSSPFEQLKDRTHRAGAGFKPVTVLTFGTVAEHGARLGYARDLFAVAGVNCRVHAESALDPQAALTVLCGPDSAYGAAREVEGQQPVWCVGTPPQDLAGKVFLHPGIDVVAVLNQALTILGAPA